MALAHVCPADPYLTKLNRPLSPDFHLNVAFQIQNLRRTIPDFPLPSVEVKVVIEAEQ